MDFVLLYGCNNWSVFWRDKRTLVLWLNVYTAHTVCVCDYFIDCHRNSVGNRHLNKRNEMFVLAHWTLNTWNEESKKEIIKPNNKSNKFHIELASERSKWHREMLVIISLNFIFSNRQYIRTSKNGKKEIFLENNSQYEWNEAQKYFWCKKKNERKLRMSIFILNLSDPFTINENEVIVSIFLLYFYFIPNGNTSSCSRCKTTKPKTWKNWLNKRSRKNRKWKKKTLERIKFIPFFWGEGKNFVRCIFSTETVCFFHFDVRFTSVHQTFVFVVFFTSNSFLSFSMIL